MDKPDSRYPYTYAADLIRSCAVEVGVKLSRSEASEICSTVAVALQVDKVDLCRQLADFYLGNQNEIDERFLRSIPGLVATS